MRAAGYLVGAALCLFLAQAPATAMTPGGGASALNAAPATAAADAGPVLLARCGPRCQAQRRALRRHYRSRHFRPYRPRPGYYYHRERRRDAAAAAIIGGVIGLGVGVAIANSRPRYYGDARAPEFDQFGQTR